MLDLRTFFKNHFDTREVSDDNLRKFVEDHLNRMISHNGNAVYTTYIQDTQVLYDKFNTFIKQEDQTFTAQQGKTLLTDKILSEFVALVSRKEGAVRSEFGKDSPEYQEFFQRSSNRLNLHTALRQLLELPLSQDIMSDSYFQVFLFSPFQSLLFRIYLPA